MMMLPPVPKLHLDSMGEYAETYIQQDPAPNELTGDQPYPLSPEGDFLNLFAIAEMEVVYCDRMPQLPEYVAPYSLDFGKNKEDSMRLYTITFSDGQTRRYAGYPPTLISQCLEKMFLDAIR